jgi:hypothetical protein
MRRRSAPHQGYLPQTPQRKPLNTTAQREPQPNQTTPQQHPPEHQPFRIERDEFAQDSRKTENQDNDVQHPGALAAIHAGKSTRNLLAL